MPKTRPNPQATSGKPQVHKFAMALQKMGHGHSRKIPHITGQKVFILMVTDYFSKWVEAEALSRTTDLQIRKFIWIHVITRFGVPEEIVIDNGP